MKYETQLTRKEEKRIQRAEGKNKSKKTRRINEGARGERNVRECCTATLA
jgi:hypothetical protein